MKARKLFTALALMFFAVVLTFNSAAHDFIEIDLRPFFSDFYLSAEEYDSEKHNVWTEPDYNFTTVSNPTNENDGVFSVQNSSFCCSFDLETGKTYEISFYVMLEENVDSGKVGIEFKPFKKNAYTDVLVINGGEWRNIKYVYTVPDNSSEKIRFDFKVFTYKQNSKIPAFYVDEILVMDYDGDKKDGLLNAIEEWNIDSNGTLVISGRGEMSDYNNDFIAPWYPFKDEIVSVVVEEGITKIGEYAFSGLPKVESVIIPESVTSIGGSAFYNCESLKGIVIPDGVTTIGSTAFADCTGLENVVIGNGVTTIGFGAFYCCTDLKNVKFNGSEKHWEKLIIKHGNESLINASISFLDPICGDLDADDKITVEDAIYLLQHSMFPEDYPVDHEYPIDFYNDGTVDIDDEILLLQHSMFPEDYPLYPNESNDVKLDKLHGIEIDLSKILIAECSKTEYKNGILTLTAENSDDPYVYLNDMLVDAEKYSVIAVKCELLPFSENSTDFQIYFATDSDPYFSERKSVKMNYDKFESCGDYMIGYFDMSRSPDWNGTITKIRFDPANSEGIYKFEKIKLIETQEEGDESVGKDETITLEELVGDGELVYDMDFKADGDANHPTVITRATYKYV